MPFFATPSKKLRGLPKLLVGFMHHKEWYSKGTLTADMNWYNPKNGKRYLPETVGRALRHLEECCVIAVKYDGISVQYKWIPLELRTRYIPWSMRSEFQKSKLFIEHA